MTSQDEKYNPDWIINQTKTPQPSPERECLFRELLSLFSTEAKEVIKLVLDSPAELIDIALTSRTRKAITLHTLTRYLRHQGWPLPTINDAFAEIKIGLKELRIEKPYTFNPMRTIFGLRKEK